MEHDLDKMRYYDEEEVIGSSTKFHRPSCQVIRNIERRNIKKFRSWENAVALGLEPCGVCRPFHKLAVRALTPALDDSSAETVSAVATTQAAESITKRATATELSDWRRGVAQLVTRVDSEPSRPDEGIAARIGRLTRNGLIPREVAAVMRTITETRNASEYESKEPSAAQSAAVRSAWEVVKEWAVSRGITVS